MKTLLLALTFATLALAASGCATSAPPASALTAADYGECPPRSRYEAVIMEQLNAAVPYSTSAKITIGEPYRAWYNIAGPDAGENKGIHYGHTIPVIVNHKDGYGDYMGEKEWKFFFQDWRLVAYHHGDGKHWFTLADPKRLPEKS